MAAKKIYIYRGSVLKFGKVVTSFWYGETTAESPKKALNNLKFQYRREHGMSQAVPLDFPGELELKLNSFDRNKED